MNCSRILFLLFSFLFFSAQAQKKNECNVPINEKSILENTNLDFFLKKLRNDYFDVSDRKEEIPFFIKETLYCLIDTIANSDEKWQVTDVVRERELPDRQLLFWGINKEKTIFTIVYQIGGIGVSTVVMLMKLTEKGMKINNQKNVEDFWVDRCFFEGKSFKDLLAFLDKHRYNNGLLTEGLYY